MLVRLTLKVPKDRVLLSAFEAWDSVLFGQPLELNEAEAERFDQCFGPGPYSGHDPVRDEAIRATWRRVFEWGLLDPAWHGPAAGMAIQAVLWELRPEWVQGAHAFICR